MTLGYFGSTLVDELNRLANGCTYPPRSQYLDESGAASAWAEALGIGDGGLSITTGILNHIAGITDRNNWLDLAGICNYIAGTTQLMPAEALRTVGCSPVAPVTWASYSPTATWASTSGTLTWATV